MAHPFCSVAASTKRSADLGSGRTGAPAAHLALLQVTPLWPLQQGTVRELAIESPREFKEAYHVPGAGWAEAIASGTTGAPMGLLLALTYAAGGSTAGPTNTDPDTLPDVREGDVLVHSGREYPIWWVGEWADMDGGIPALQIVVQEVKGS